MSEPSRRPISAADPDPPSAMVPAAPSAAVDVSNPVIYQSVVSDRVLDEMMDQVARRGQRTRAVNWEHLPMRRSPPFSVGRSTFGHMDDVTEATADHPTSAANQSDRRQTPRASEQHPFSVGDQQGAAPTSGASEPRRQNGEGVWSPGSAPTTPVTERKQQQQQPAREEEQERAPSHDVSPVWKPFSYTQGDDKPQYQNVKLKASHFQKSTEKTQVQEHDTPTYPPPPSFANTPPVETPSGRSIKGILRQPSTPAATPAPASTPAAPPAVPPKTLSLRQTLTSEQHSSSTTSHATTAPSRGPDASPPTFTRVNSANIRLPPSQSPTITLLQKAREGQIPKGAIYIDHKMNSKEEQYQKQPGSYSNGNHPGPLYDPQFAVKSEEVYDDRRVIKLEPVKYEGVGPLIKGVPIALCTGVKDENKAEWYRRMYRSLHRGNEPDGRIPYSSQGGYMSEPEPERDDDYYYRKYATLDRRKLRDDEYSYHQSNGSKDKSKPPSLWSPPSARYSSDIYKNQPKRIEDYEPGRSSIAEMEAKLRPLTYLYSMLMLKKNSKPHGNQHSPQVNRPSRQYMFKDGYESDSTLVYRKRGPPDNLSSSEQRAWYKEFQQGGDIPLSGFRRAAPEKPVDYYQLDSSVAATSLELDKVEFGFPLPPPKVPLIDPEPPHRYQDAEVNIHYRSPVHNLEKELINEDELRIRQEQMMKQFYEDEKRKKAMQELTDIENRRHNDNFIPSQKSPIPLNRYDNLFEDQQVSPVSARTPEPKTVARATYSFAAQNSRELSFDKGDLIFIHRKIDKNWYEGEHHGLVGLFPVNHVQIMPYDTVRLTPKKPSEGQARAKYNFQAQSPMELSLVKGETVILIRRVDNNWYEGRIGGLKGIFPKSYVEVLSEPGMDIRGSHSPTSKPISSPVSHSLIMNGSAMSPKLSNSYSQPSYYGQRVESYSTPYATTRRYAPPRPTEPLFDDKIYPLDQTLHIHTQTDPIPYRALYAYKPQNDDELELHDSDVVYVMEKCDDGWFVGSSQRTGLFGTFPGNYVERI